MRILIYGTQTYTNIKQIEQTITHLQKQHTNLTIITGTAPGTDQIVKTICQKHHIKHETTPASWGKYGKKQDYQNNIDLATTTNPDMCILAYQPGTQNQDGINSIINICNKNNIPITKHLK